MLTIGPGSIGVSMPPGPRGRPLLNYMTQRKRKVWPRALNDEGWRPDGIAAQSPWQGRAIERLNDSSTVSSTSTNIDVQSALHHPMAASADAHVLEVRCVPRGMWPRLT